MKKYSKKRLVGIGIICLLIGAVIFLYASVVVVPVDNILAFKMIAASVFPLVFGLFFLLIGFEGSD